MTEMLELHLKDSDLEISVPGHVVIRLHSQDWLITLADGRAELQPIPAVRSSSRPTVAVRAEY